MMTLRSGKLPSIFDSTLVDNFRLVAFDLPGNGKSSHAPFPTQTYSYLGIAATIQEFLLTLYNKEKDPLWLSPIIVGWSLGGHAAIELINSVHDFHLPSVSGLVLCGTPPVNLTKPSKNNEGFLLNPEILKMKYLSAFSRLQSQQFYTAAGITVTYPHYFINCGQQMDGRARTFLQDWKNTSEAKSINQAATVAETTIPIAVF